MTLLKITSPFNEGFNFLHTTMQKTPNGDRIAVVDLTHVEALNHVNPTSKITYELIDNTVVNNYIVHTTADLVWLETTTNAICLPISDNLFKISKLNANAFNIIINDYRTINITEDDVALNIMQSSFLNNTSIYLSDLSTNSIDLSQLSPTVSTSTTNWALKRLFNRTMMNSTITRLNPIVKIPTYVYLMDSGVRSTHNEFSNNVENLFSITPNDYSDNIGHGTQMASAIVGKTVGVSPENVIIKNVKIIDPSVPSTISNIIDAFNSIKNFATNNKGIHIVNMSWIINKNSTIENVIQSMIDQGIMFVCSAGNTGLPIETLTPASMKSVITVGSIDESNVMSGFNNYNTSNASVINFTATSVDIFAPGKNCTAASHLTDNTTLLSTGTSISSAYVSGIAAMTALLLYPTINNQATLFNKLVELSTKEMITIPGTNFSMMPNRIAWCIALCDEISITQPITISKPGLFDGIPNINITTLPVNTTIAEVFVEYFNEKDPTTNFIYNKTIKETLQFHAPKAKGFVISELVTVQKVNLPIVLYIVQNNYFNTISLTLTEKVIPSLALQVKTVYNTISCSTACASYPGADPYIYCMYCDLNSPCDTGTCNKKVWYRFEQPVAHYHSDTNGYWDVYGACYTTGFTAFSPCAQWIGGVEYVGGCCDQTQGCYSGTSTSRPCTIGTGG